MPSSENLRVTITDYASHAADIRNVREVVFIQEQQIAREDEWDDRDEVCIHVVAYHEDKPIGTGRVDLEKAGKVGRVAVKSEFRRHGIGRAMMKNFEEYAQQQGLPKLWFHAQQTAVDFYRSLDYEVVSEEFFEAGIPHVIMEKSFAKSVS
ncbi:MAG: GNAT family N-acetyltransferase [Pirellulaceae bacterium]